MSRLDEARKVAQELLEELETSRAPIETVLMKAKRLARLMRDTDAQAWLDLETRGYPDSFNFEQLGSCKKYALAAGRITSDGEYYLISLPKLVAKGKSDEALIDAMRSSREAFIVSQYGLPDPQKETYACNQALFASLKSGLHNYATDIYLAIELGDVAEEIFEQARGDVDSFVRIHCPKAAEQLVVINERLHEDSPESLVAALTSCRRLLKTVADSLFPPQDQPWTDLNGKTRTVGSEEYKNRLLAYVEQKISSDSSFSIIVSEIEHLAARLDAVYEKVCKGVHADVSKEEARLAVIHTYLFLGEIARLSKKPKNGGGEQQTVQTL